MADAGMMRKPEAGTLTRADLADVVHNEIGLSRSESASIVERISTTCVRRCPKGRM
jgi:integration host factor subunit alpha